MSMATTVTASRDHVTKWNGSTGPRLSRGASGSNRVPWAGS
jgi:hypothetical protein